jgi:putative SOS response-associated peptidase YedK
VCGRYVLASPGELIAEHFRLAAVPVYPPRYNIAPTQAALVVRAMPDGSREAASLRWGLVPFWAKDPSIGSRLINARAEGLADRPAFRAAFRQRRCLVPADGFFEWRKLAGGRKQPYYVRLASGAPFAMAGLWELWRPSQGDAIATFTVVTTQASEALHAVHDRMPVIVASADYDAWLCAPDPSALLGPAPGEPFEIVPIGTRVNDVRNDDPGLLAPLAGV